MLDTLITLFIIFFIIALIRSWIKESGWRDTVKYWQKCDRERREEEYRKKWGDDWINSQGYKEFQYEEKWGWQWKWSEEYKKHLEEERKAEYKRLWGKDWKWSKEYEEEMKAKEENTLLPLP